jgi:hypothetical protein
MRLTQEWVSITDTLERVVHGSFAFFPSPEEGEVVHGDGARHFELASIRLVQSVADHQQPDVQRI